MSGLVVERLSVRFGGVRALENVDMEVAEHGCHGIIGPNGAGKTTLLNAVCGLVRPSGGRVMWAGAPIPSQPRKLAGLGMARTFQTAAVYPSLTALENVMVGGHVRTRAGLFRSMVGSPRSRRDETELEESARELLDLVRFDVDPSAAAADLSFAHIRKVEVARALMSRPQLLLLDEPTAGLSALEVEQFRHLLNELRDRERLTIVVIEHNVPFVFGLCERVTAFDNGRVIASGSAAEVRGDRGVLASYLGRDGATEATARETRRRPPGPAKRRADGLTVQDVTSGYGRTIVLRDLSLEVRRGEVVAIFGRNGAGKSTLINTIVGAVRARAGRVEWSGRRLERLPVDRIVRAGVSVVPHGRALIEQQSVDDNLVLATFWMRLSRRETKARREDIYARFPRLYERRDSLAGSLSGGERQMLAIGKTLMRRPALLLLDEPSAGLAPSIVDDLQDIVAQLRDEGLTILVAEQNVGWVVPLAERACVVDRGQIVASGDPDELSDFESLAGVYLGEAGMEGQALR